MGLTLSAATLATLAAAGTCLAQADQPVTLRIGDKAPALQVSHWLKGKPVEQFEPGKVYVVECWATWCAPCRGSIPHLSELQDRLADYNVTLIGVSNEPLQDVVAFLPKPHPEVEGKLWNEMIRYTLATDPDKSVFDEYMTASGTAGIPAAFVVGKDGRIEWIGRPHYPKGEIDRVLDSLVSDSWGRDQFKTIFDLRHELESARKDDAERAVSLADRLIELDPAGTTGYKDRKFRLLLAKLERPGDAYPIGRELVEAFWDESSWLNGLAWFIATDEGVKTRDLDLALKAATRASDLTRNRDAGTLDTVARVYYEQGRLDKAISWQEKAVNNAAEGKGGDEIRQTLEQYRKEKDEKGGMGQRS